MIGPRARWAIPILMCVVGATAALGWLWLAPQGHVVWLLEAHAAQWRATSLAHPLIAGAAFVAIYAFAVVVMLPVALVLTMGSGFLFGALPGAGLSVIAAVIGGLIGFSLGRASAAPGSTLNTLDSARLTHRIARAPFRAILVLRLLPLTPFTPVSVAAGWLHAPVAAFVAGTGLGVLPESGVYAFAGNGLRSAFLRGDTRHAAAFARPQLLGPLAAVALLIALGVVFSARSGSERPPAP